MKQKKISLKGAILILIGQIVGIGLFFKNMSIFNANNGNPYGIIGSWVIGAIMTLTVALTIGKIVEVKQKECKSLGVTQ
jgi:amino acid transporter